MSNRRTGKIARLPFAARTGVNNALRDGLPYVQIIGWLAEHHGTKDINEQNLTNWKDGGHQDWLREQARLEEMQAKREFALEMVRQNEGSKIHEANLHLVASQMYEALTEFDLSGLKDLLAEKPENYEKLVGSIAKMSKANVEVQKYKDANARAMAEVEKAKSVIERGGGLTAETLERIERELKLL